MVEAEFEKNAVDSGLERDEDVVRDVSDGQNRSFRYTL